MRIKTLLMAVIYFCSISIPVYTLAEPDPREAMIHRLGELEQEGKVFEVMQTAIDESKEVNGEHILGFTVSEFKKLVTFILGTAVAVQQLASWGLK